MCGLCFCTSSICHCGSSEWICILCMRINCVMHLHTGIAVSIVLYFCTLANWVRVLNCVVCPHTVTGYGSCKCQLCRVSTHWCINCVMHLHTGIAVSIVLYFCTQANWVRVLNCVVCLHTGTGYGSCMSIMLRVHTLAAGWIRLL